MAWYDELVERWKPSRGWRDAFVAAVKRIETHPADMKAWCDVVIMLGDTHATEFSLIVCLHARTLGGDQAQLSSHLHLCLLDLGVASAPGPVPLRDPASVMTVDDEALAGWTRGHLAPFDGDLSRAVAFVLELAQRKLA